MGWNAFHNRTIDQLREGVEAVKVKLEDEESDESFEAYIRQVRGESRNVPITNLVVPGIGSLCSSSNRLADNKEGKWLNEYHLNVAL